MHDRRSALLLAALSPAMLAPGCASEPSPVDVESFIVERSRRWTACFTTGDTTVMEEILAADFVNTSPSGTRSTKAESIRSAREGPSMFASTRLDALEVKIHGAVALAFGQDLLYLKASPNAPVRTVWTDTWLLRNGQWCVVASHESVVRASGAS
jgi:hypothetical protein